ncbi:MAG: hypothetical protein QF917_00140 [Candidatus Woesearchaeota archaeon]|jgi:uncharacterized protein (UPF0333 family)|nr:hypothetical protein [Candidatus Woesearchaeota archaeon]|tara:strand:- start:17677 stop:17808 length:132 start_codon:yes stop_codon:yes gene_type:complete
MIWNKKGQGAPSYRFLIKILLIILVAATLYFMIKGIVNAFTPK